MQIPVSWPLAVLGRAIAAPDVAQWATALKNARLGWATGEAQRKTEFCWGRVNSETPSGRECE
jgi:hypothetical protein